MGKQFQVYLLPSDAVKLVEALRKTVSMYLLPFRLDGPDLAEIELPVRSLGGVARVECFFTPSLSSAIKIRHVPQQGYWIIQSLYSDVIEFSGCHFDGKALRRGRLFYDSGFYTDEGRWQQKSPVFIAWADKVFKYAKTFLNRSARVDAYIGEEAGHWQAMGGLFLANGD